MQAEKDTTENCKIIKVVEKVRADCYSPNLAILQVWALTQTTSKIGFK